MSYCITSSFFVLCFIFLFWHVVSVLFSFVPFIGGGVLFLYYLSFISSCFIVIGCHYLYCDISFITSCGFFFACISCSLFMLCFILFDKLFLSYLFLFCSSFFILGCHSSYCASSFLPLLVSLLFVSYCSSRCFFVFFACCFFHICLLFCSTFVLTGCHSS